MERLFNLQAEDSDGGILGNIYVAKVRNIVKNINAAFVEFAKGQMGYLPLTGDSILHRFIPMEHRETMTVY